MDAFKQRKISKEYIAFVHGKLKRPVGEIKSLIQDLDEKKYRRHSQPVLAITRYKVIEAKSKFSVVEVTPVTAARIRLEFISGILGIRSSANVNTPSAGIMI